MNFFEHQQRAQRRSTLLVLLFLLAVAAIVVATNLTVLVAFYVADSAQLAGLTPFPVWLHLHPRLVIWTSIITITFIGSASLYRMAILGRGGSAVAQMLGGARIDPDTRDPLRRQLHNVVEETAIAAALPVPEVYVLETEAGINAFAAGFSPNDAVIAVTRGMLENLTRDELQGVIAHEFSHIRHGDTRLNMRLIGASFGILAIALTGRMLLRGVVASRSSRSDGRAIMAGYAVGVLLIVIGYIGVLAARLIKAAVSRDRERLADASAVQFTRSTEGLAGALKKIAVSPMRATLVSAQGEEVSHMLIAEDTGLFSRLFASHPPLIERIRLLEPRFEPAELEKIKLGPMREFAPGPAPEPTPLPELLGLATHREVARVGAPGQPARQTAAALDRDIAPILTEAAHSPQDAVDLVLALLLGADAGLRALQLQRIRERLSSAAPGHIENLAAQVQRLDTTLRLPLLDMAFPALRQQPPLDLRNLIGLVDDLTRINGLTRIFDYALSRLLHQMLAETLAPSAGSRAGLKLNALHSEVQTLFSLMAQAGHAEPEESRAAFEAGLRRLLPSLTLSYAPPQPWVEALDNALMRLDRLAPLVKQELIAALAETVLHDRRVMLAETELLRVICACLHCPLPSLQAAAA